MALQGQQADRTSSEGDRTFWDSFRNWTQVTTAEIMVKSEPFAIISPS